MTTKGNMHREEKILVRVSPEIAELIPGFLENRRKDIVEVICE
jgi:hypothetical protein